MRTVYSLLYCRCRFVSSHSFLCSAALTRLYPFCTVFPVWSSALNSQTTTTASPSSLRSHSALFHQSISKASPDSNKPAAVNSGQELELAIGMWSLGLAAVGAAVAGILLANTDLCLPKAGPASLEFLGDADLRSTLDEDNVIKALSLWQKSGAVVMVEASELSSLKPRLEELGVPLVAVVKENIGTEVQHFRPHFAGDIYVDEKKHFYGPLQRKMGAMGFIRLGVWQNFIRAWRTGYEGNMNGEGFILGGVFVIGAGEQGILLEHREKEFGDKVKTKDVLEAVKKIVQVK